MELRGRNNVDFALIISYSIAFLFGGLITAREITSTIYLTP